MQKNSIYKMEISQDIKILKDNLSKKLDSFNKIRFGDSYKTQEEINNEIDNNNVKKAVVKEDVSDSKKVIRTNTSSTTKFGTSLFGRIRRR